MNSNPFNGLRNALQEAITSTAEKCPACGKPTAGILFNKAGYRQGINLQTKAEAGLCDCKAATGPTL